MNMMYIRKSLAAQASLRSTGLEGKAFMMLSLWIILELRSMIFSVGNSLVIGRYSCMPPKWCVRYIHNKRLADIFLTYTALGNRVATYTTLHPLRH